ncbi:MAG: hypothetical protein SNJ71_04010, partial [Bacteroidales bacterium]
DLRQSQITQTAWQTLKTGGLMIYSTCTYNRKENEHIISQLLENYDAECERLTFPQEWGIQVFEYNNTIVYRCLPYLVEGEGFSFSILRKLKSTQKRINRKNRNKIELYKAPQEFFLCNKKLYLFNYADVQFAIDEQATVLFQQMNELHFIGSGILASFNKGKDFIPHPAFAFCEIVNTSKFEIAELDYNTALRFFKKETLVLNDNKLAWFLLLYEKEKIGIVKNLGNRINNSYPSEWRIRL